MRRLLVLCLSVLASSCDIASGLDDFTIASESTTRGGAAGAGAAGGSGGDGGDMACGDGERDADEECDDGNRVDDDGCDSTCTVQCPGGWTKADNLHCYFAANMGMSWMEALAFCPAVDVGARPSTPHLATITTPEEQAIADDLTPQGASHWLGASDIDAEGTWQWDDGEPWDWPLNVSPPWASGDEPNNAGGAEDCLQLYDTGLFNDGECNTGLAPLCELDPPGP